MSLTKPPSRRRADFPTSLTDLHRLGKSVHGHDGSSRIVMVRKTDQRTFASSKNGKEPKLETITRETIETFRGQRTACKITTEKKDFEDQLPIDLINSFNKQYTKNLENQNNLRKKPNRNMEFALDCLKWHNEYRARHDCPPLILNQELCTSSFQLARTLIRQRILRHTNTEEHGENIYTSNSCDYKTAVIDGEEPVKAWYQEMQYYTFGREPTAVRTGNFSQLIWKGTKEVGIGIVKKCEKVVVVAQYLPAGNVLGQFIENVPPPLAGLEDDNIRRSLCQLNISNSQKSLTNGTSGDFELDFLNSHNEFRKRHGVPPLKLDKKLCKHSEEWARILTSKNNLEHRKNSPYGENIYCIYSSDPNFTITGHAPVETWYEEIKQHPFGREPNNLKSGHFTQVIWKTSELLGVGVAKSRQGYIYVVANYSPAGNFLGSFNENVPPPLPTTSLKDVEPVEMASKLDEQSGFDTFALEALAVHNDYRKKHGVGEMVLSKDLCDYANEWAKKCLEYGKMAHRPDNKSYGENFFYIYSSDFSFMPCAKDVVKGWYDEMKSHEFNSESVNFKSLHFTQVIWKNSTKLGIGLAKNKKGKIYVVANYEPRGNFVGSFSENVLPPIIPTSPKYMATGAKAMQLTEESEVDKIDNKFLLEALKVHNEYRRQHGVREMVLKNDLCNYAKEWAENCAKVGNEVNRLNNKYGENIFYKPDHCCTPTAKEVIKAWYDEIKYHKFGSESINFKSLHFTQLIWKNSVYLGVGLAKNDIGHTYVVANYLPKGNVIGSFSENVPPPIPSTSFKDMDDLERSLRIAEQSEFDIFAIEGLEVHNEYRKKHGIGEMILSKDLCNNARKWAERCSKGGKMAPYPNNKYGENTCCKHSSNVSFTPSARDAIKAWYDEIKFHKFGSESPNFKSLHFTQVIWKNSTNLGMAFAKNKKGKIYIVANYSPTGNVIDSFSENVPPPIPSTSLKEMELVERMLKLEELGEFDRFAYEGLKAHNEYRKKHGVGKMVLKIDLCNYAKEWAESCAFNTKVAYRPNNKYGENIFYKNAADFADTPTAREAIKAWYDEIKYHEFGSESINHKSLHFTQLIWKNSINLGIALAKNPKGKCYIVANYSPAGNLIGSFSENVSPPIPPTYLKDMIDAEKALKLAQQLELEKLDEEFAVEALAVHNEYRRTHGVGDMVLVKDMCDFAKEWAEKCAKTGFMAHRPNNKYGENIFYMYSSDFTFTPPAKEAITRWYDEIEHYKFGSESLNYKSLHFTQIIWKNSTNLGIAFAKNNKGQTFIVANYAPRGNFIGSFCENVPPPTASISSKPMESCYEKLVKEIEKPEFNKFALEALKIHNECRNKHGVGKLVLSKELCDYAKEWADNCSKTGNMAHRPNNSYGENIFCLYSSDFSFTPTAKDAVKKWYDEVRDHRFGSESVNHNTLHFSQVVWKNSTKLGIALAKNSKGQTYVVANYEPRGNIVGQFLSNVPKLKA